MPSKSPFAKQWGARIRAARRQLGQPQEWLADQLGVRQSEISRWESGERVPPDIHRVALAGLLGVDLHALFSYDDTNGDDKAA